MKTRSKLLLAAVSLLTVSVAATATSAYAWYTANRQVTATVNKIGVEATSGNLAVVRSTDAVDSFSSVETGKTTEGYPSILASASGLSLTDVSSRGDGSFVKPKFDAAGTSVVGEYTQTGDNIGQKTVKLSDGVGASPTAINAYGVISLDITISNTAGDSATPLAVYIDKSSSLTSATTSVKNSARFSIIKKESSNSTVIYGSPTADAQAKYYYLESAAGDQAEVSSNLVADKSNCFKDDAVSVTTPADENKKAANGYIGTINAQSSARYLITMWVEGTDNECVLPDSAINSSLITNDLALNLKLYALEA